MSSEGDLLTLVQLFKKKKVVPLSLFILLFFEFEKKKTKLLHWANILVSVNVEVFNFIEFGGVFRH